MPLINNLNSVEIMLSQENQAEKIICGDIEKAIKDFYSLNNIKLSEFKITDNISEKFRHLAPIVIFRNIKDEKITYPKFLVNLENISKILNSLNVHETADIQKEYEKSFNYFEEIKISLDKEEADLKNVQGISLDDDIKFEVDEKDRCQVMTNNILRTFLMANGVYDEKIDLQNHEKYESRENDFFRKLNINTEEIEIDDYL